jgi:hypothetical protein
MFQGCHLNVPLSVYSEIDASLPADPIGKASSFFQ